MAEVTELLQQARAGETDATERAYALLYEDLRRLAHARLRQSGEQSQLSTTVVVHEAFLRIRDVDGLDFGDRGHFLAYASRAMRSVVVDVARSRLAQRHGGLNAHTAFDTHVADNTPAADDDEILRVHEGLAELAQVDARLAQVVELRYFAGLGDAEIAALLGLTERTVRRDWKKARLFLATALR